MRFMTHILLFLVACCVEKYILPDISFADVKNFYSRTVTVIKSKNIPVPEILNIQTTQPTPYQYTIISTNTYSDLPERAN